MHSSISPGPSPTLSPTTAAHPPLDLRHLFTPQTLRDPAKPQEQGNTKKKRRSLSGMENAYPPGLTTQQQAAQQPSIPDSPESRPSAYGDPMKIAQYFPELN